MVLYGVLCGLGVEGGLILGLTAAEVIAGYWNKRNRTNPVGSPLPPPQKVYFFNRRMHHGQIGALLMLSLFFRGTSVPAAILTGLGIGLVKDDYADFKEWFLFKKKMRMKMKNPPNLIMIMISIQVIKKLLKDIYMIRVLISQLQTSPLYYQCVKE
jgi:hypothetical protein